MNFVCPANVKQYCGCLIFNSENVIINARIYVNMIAFRPSSFIADITDLQSSIAVLM
jgi:hypothetical protein